MGLGTPLIIVLTDPEAGLTQRLVDDGHHVFAAYGPGASDFVGARRLPRPWKFDLQIALTHAGLREEDAHRLAHASGRSVTVLRRLMPAAPSYRATWAEPASPELVAALFAGAWVESSARDRKIIGNLAGRRYEDVEAALAPLTGLGGPLVRAGEVWKVVSLRDLWTQIGGQVTPTQLARFEAAFQTVLGAINPRYATPPKSIYHEEKGEFPEEPSNALRRGLTEAMIASGRLSRSGPTRHRRRRPGEPGRTQAPGQSPTSALVVAIPRFPQHRRGRAGGVPGCPGGRVGRR